MKLKEVLNIVDVSQLKKLFDAEYLDKEQAEINLLPSEQGSETYHLIVKKVSGENQIASRARGIEPKVYIRINGAFNDARLIGFKKIVINLDEKKPA